MARMIPINAPDAVGRAGDVLRTGGLVVLPTDTVYGLASAIDEAAIAHVFLAKQRAPERAVPVLLSSVDAVELVAGSFGPEARRLAAAFWPGPLTIVVPKRYHLPRNLSMLPTVGLRVPDHTATRAVIAAAGGALAVTSANRSDEPAACTIQAAKDMLGDSVALYLDGGPCQGGIPSTVVAIDDGHLRIIREGPIAERVLKAALRAT